MKPILNADPRLLAALALALVLALALPDAAWAQGQIQTATTWTVTNIARPLISVGVVAIGALALLFRISWGFVIPFVIGGLLIANYQAVAGLFGGV